MSTVTALPHGRVWTRADRDALPDDGHRQELIDGLLVVTPSPSRDHQRLSGRLQRRLAELVPAGLEVLAAPLDVELARDTVVQPDLIVATLPGPGEASVSPILVIEILSPSTRLYDLNLKKSRYEAARIAHYWVIEPQSGDLWVWTLDGAQYRQVAEVTGDSTFSAEAPFPVTLAPQDRTGRVL